MPINLFNYPERAMFLNAKQKRSFEQMYPKSKIPAAPTVDKMSRKKVRAVPRTGCPEGSDYGSNGFMYDIMLDEDEDFTLSFILTTLITVGEPNMIIFDYY